MLAQLSRIARWAIVAAAVVGVMLVGAANSGAAVEPSTTIHDYNIYDDNADFWFRSDVAGATFECRLDDAAFETCVSPVNYRGLPEGTHRFEVRAVDSEGVVDSSPANLTFTSAPQPPPPPSAPPNDNWYGAESISGTSGSVEGTNVDATTQWDEPYNPDGAERTVEGEIVPTCTPTSGSTFAVGDTTVTCSATDASGNTGTASFNVHVKGGDEQLADLRGYVDSLALEKNLADRLRAQIADIRKHLAQGHTNAVCGGLADLVAEAENESGKRLTPEQAERIVADSMRIRAVVGC